MTIDGAVGGRKLERPPDGSSGVRVLQPINRQERAANAAPGRYIVVTPSDQGASHRSRRRYP